MPWQFGPRVIVSIDIKLRETKQSNTVLFLLLVISSFTHHFQCLNKASMHRSWYRPMESTYHFLVSQFLPHSGYLDEQWYLAIQFDSSICQCPNLSCSGLHQVPQVLATPCSRRAPLFYGGPLELLKALYELQFSGLLLFKAMSEFMEEFGLQKSVMNGLWFKHLPEGGLLIFLMYSDDCLSCCTDDKVHQDFCAAFALKFPLNAQPNASWYLAAQIFQDGDGNMSNTTVKMLFAICKILKVHANSWCSPLQGIKAHVTPYALSPFQRNHVLPRPIHVSSIQVAESYW